MASLTAQRSQNEAVFTINKKIYRVDDKIKPDTSLNTYIRDHANLRGTKFMCQEGGCGSCVVTATFTHPGSGEKVSYAVNSCLLPVLSCHGWAITTIEGVGNKADGYNHVQTRLMQMNGTQCGYCSPGMVMNMYSLLERSQPTMLEVENSFGGNMCRCTGYRSIMDAFKSLASDAPPELLQKCCDIEELHKLTVCSKTGNPCKEECRVGGSVHMNETRNAPLIYIQSEGSKWFTVSTITEILDILNRIGTESYMLVAGNTAQGVYGIAEDPINYININDVKELKTHSEDPSLVLGANMCLTEAMELFNKLSTEQLNKYGYAKALADHIDLIANVPVRNMGTIAGNLSIKHKHRDFPSDVFLILETVGATLDIVNKAGSVENVSLTAYLDLDMNHKLIKSIHLPELDESYQLRTYKIMPRAQNAHALVNAGFLFKFNPQKKGQIIGRPRILFGGINSEFINAIHTEDYLQQQNIIQHGVLTGALESLDKELKPDYILTESSPKYRKTLAQGLFYKALLDLFPDAVKDKLKSGGQMFVRPVSSGRQDYLTDKSKWPLNQPIPKVEALVQCSGEAKYVNDNTTIPGELFAAFVLTTVAQGNIAKVNPAKALSLEGVVAFIGPDDIPGRNNFISTSLQGFQEPEEILCSGVIIHNGQPLGIIVAKTLQIAQRAAKLVEVEYRDVKKPLIHVEDVLKSGESSRVVEKNKILPTNPEAKHEAKHIIKGSFVIGSQYHYTMETQSCLCVPIEDGMDVYPASQWMDLIQIAVSQALGVPENSINVIVRRLGGAYGAKISRSAIVATACALAANHTRKPVRMILSMQDNMRSLGKRFGITFNYEVGVDDNGVIKYMDSIFYENAGSSFNESVVAFTLHHFLNCYDSSTWTISGKAVRTDIPSNTYCRAPGSTEGIAAIENVMEHIAKVLNKDPVEIRLKNMKDKVLPQLIDDIKTSSSYDERLLSIEEFNKENRWRKRGMSLVTMQYPFGYWGNFPAMLSVYAGDGTVAVSHGGIECGQGINTKVVQVCAYTLGIPLELVMVKPSNNLTAANAMVTGGSLASEAVAYATIMCCKEILKRLEPIKEKMKDPTWKELVSEAYKQNIDLCCTYMFTSKDDVAPYSIYGVTVTEVEVDLLTGQQQIKRVDILEDAGDSLSPEIDIGQVEGAYIMGLGLYTMEEIKHNPDNGEVVTNRTWNYKIPGVKDIPIDFRIQLRRNAPNPTGVLRSKATGEPPLCMSVGILFALRYALDSARHDAGHTESWYPLNAPATTESILLTAITKPDQFLF